MFSYRKATVGAWIKTCDVLRDSDCLWVPHDVDSWRGIYSEPTVIVGNEPGKFGDWIPFLHRLTTETFSGWKGGEYTYNDESILNLEYDASMASEYNTQGDMFKSLFSEYPSYLEKDELIKFMKFYTVLLSY